MLLKFSRNHRLAKRCDFQSVFASPHKILFKYLMVKYQFNQADQPRLGVIVGKHVIYHATDRNRFRRVIRESFRHHQKSLKGLDIVVVMRSKCSPLPKSNLSRNRSLNVHGTRPKDRERRAFRRTDNQTLRNDINNLWHQLVTSLKKV